MDLVILPFTSSPAGHDPLEGVSKNKGIL